MKKKILEKLEYRAKLLKALAHPTRLFIIDELAKNEQCVYDLTKMIGVDVSTVSKHLSLLKNVGVIKGEKRKANVFYKLKMPCAPFMCCIKLDKKPPCKK